jgi:exodeoxyribonuclease III
VRIVSWNVNGLRAVMQKGFGAWLEGCGADVVGLQETRGGEVELARELESLHQQGWRTFLNPARKKGYSGTMLLCREQPDLMTHVAEDEGRCQLMTMRGMTIVNTYFPNGSGPARDNSRIPYKLDFYRALHAQLASLVEAGQRVLVMGDFNTAPDDIDLARPRDNRKTSGFTDEERAEVHRWLRTGYTDAFRHRCADGGRYSWWSQRFGVREKNIGWRIDLTLVSHGLLPHVRDAFIWHDVRGSDHCPVGVDVDV